MPEHKEVTEIIEEDSAAKLERFKLELTDDADLMEDQREAANEDMIFANVEGGMWLDWQHNDKFENRVKLQIDMISDYVNRQYGEWTLNRVGVDYRPTDEATTDKDAETLGNMFRADFRDNSGRISVDNAVLEVLNCGIGAVKMGTVFADESDPESQLQDIEWRPKHNAYNSVFWDGGAERIDKQDATRCTELTAFTKKGFEAIYPEENPISVFDPDNLWRFNFNNNQSHDIIYVATRYDKIRRKVPVFVYNNLKTNKQEFYFKEDHELIKDELAADDLIEFVDERMVIQKTIEKSVFSGDTFFVESKRIIGKLIPIIPFYGYRIFVDNMEWYKGLIRDLKDACRVLNMLLSQVAENAASGHSQIPVFTRDQIPKDLIKFWTDSTNGPPAYRLVDPQLDGDGKAVSSAPVTILPAPQIDQNVKELVQITMLYLRERTGAAPQETLDPKASGKAINAIIKRVNMNTQPIMDNTANAVQLMGDVYASMAQEVFAERRVKATLSKDGTDGRLEIGQSILDEETGTMVTANTFGEKAFKAYSDVGAAFSTIREETVETLKGVIEMLKGTPGMESLQKAAISEMIENMPGTSSGVLKKVNRRSMIVTGLIEPETDEEKQMLQQAQQQSQQDPQAELIAAASEQARGEAEQAKSIARERDSKAIVNIADARKKSAETQKIVSETETDRVKTFAELRKQAFDVAKSLPF